MINDQIIERIRVSARNMRKKTLDLAHQSGPNGAHLGPALSMIEIMATLYIGVMRLFPNNPYSDERDRFILSKGHGSLGLYTALFEAGLITDEELQTFEENGGFLPGQPTRNIEKGIEFSSGTLGFGLPLGVGVAISAKKLKRNSTVYVLMGDGECNEGSVWEAAMLASHLHLNNLVAIIDYNKMQSDGKSVDILDMGDMADKWQSFGWDTAIIDGHNITELYETFTQSKTHCQNPRMIIANTVKGKGVSFMEQNREWHHNRLAEKLYLQAIEELKGKRS